jgi:hypothetical protein
LCQEDNYLLELVRYIHLNPLRAEKVPDLKKLERYAYCGHGVLMGYHRNDWQSVDEVLKLFGKNLFLARRRYREFVKNGVNQGRRHDLVGGGLIRSIGGWQAFSDFVEEVLKKAQEKRERQYQLEAEGYSIDQVAERVAVLLGVECERVWKKGKHPKTVKARSLLCYWGVRELGISATELARRIGITQPAISQSVKRGDHRNL